MALILTTEKSVTAQITELLKSLFKERGEIEEKRGKLAGRWEDRQARLNRVI